jgi:hypothetical protein
MFRMEVLVLNVHVLGIILMMLGLKNRKMINGSEVKTNDTNMEKIALLHPVAQVVLIAGCCTTACVFFYQVWKTIREQSR